MHHTKEQQEESMYKVSQHYAGKKIAGKKI